jgi:hypothetical protein
VSTELGGSLDRMRRRRNRSEYGSAYFERRELDAAIATARAIVEAVDTA